MSTKSNLETIDPASSSSFSVRLTKGLTSLRWSWLLLGMFLVGAGGVVLWGLSLRAQKKTEQANLLFGKALELFLADIKEPNPDKNVEAKQSEDQDVPQFSTVAERSKAVNNILEQLEKSFPKEKVTKWVPILRAKLELTDDQGAKAEPVYRSASTQSDLQSLRPWLLENVGSALEQQKRWKDAAGIYQTARGEKDTSYYKPLFELALARVQFLQGDKAAAVASYKELLKNKDLRGFQSVLENRLLDINQ